MDFQDLHHGKVFYVRGRKAICRSVEFPLLHWVFEGDDKVYHRSWLADSPMFSLTPLGADAAGNAASKQVESKPVKGEVVNSVKDPSSSLIDAFKSRPAKNVFENLTGETITSEVKAPGSVHLENCSDTRLILVHKVSSITLLNCKNVQLFFPSVISTCEVIKCSDCQIFCSQSCPTFTLDDSHKVKVTIPRGGNQGGGEAKLSVVTFKSSGISLLASASVPTNGDIPSSSPSSQEDNVQYSIDSSNKEDSKQMLTVYADGQFHTSELKREETGYVKIA